MWTELSGKKPLLLDTVEGSGHFAKAILIAYLDRDGFLGYWKKHFTSGLADQNLYDNMLIVTKE